jgi:hypothetical protein
MTTTSPETGGAHLPGCSSCGSRCEPEDIRCAVCGTAIAAQRSALARAAAQILRCRDCGAALKYSADQGAKCAFCGSRLELETPVDPTEQAQSAVPFTLSPDQARATLHAWLGRQGFFTPSDLQSTAQLDSLRPLWWAGWVVDAQTLVSWAADSNAGARTATWAPHAGQLPMNFERLVVSASRGLTFEEAARLTAHTSFTHQVAASSTDPGLTIEQFDAQRSAARRIVVAALESTAAARLQRGTIPGSRVRNLHVAVLLQGLTTRRILLPAYVLAYRYQGRLYRSIVHGQDSSCVFGAVPRSLWKILLVILGVGAFLIFALFALILIAAAAESLK